MALKNIYVGSAILIAAALTLLIVVSISQKPNSKKNGFKRHFTSTPIKLLNSTSTKQGLSDICGYTSHHIFFSLADPREIISVNYSLNSFDSIFLPIPLKQNGRLGAKTYLDSPKVRLLQGNLSDLVSYTIGAKMFYTIKLHPPLFTHLTMLNGNKLVVRAFDTTRSFQIFEKLNSETGSLIRQSPILTKEDSLGFSTDGLLQFDSLTNTILFVQFYQNRFLAIDTNLKVIFTAHTIDTITQQNATTKTLIQGTTGSIQSASPLVIINRQCSTFKGNLLILSGLKSDNESEREFYSNSVIDIYDVKTGYYKSSFYIPNIDGDKAIIFKVVANILVVLYKTHIATYGFSGLISNF